MDPFLSPSPPDPFFTALVIPYSFTPPLNPPDLWQMSLVQDVWQEMRKEMRKPEKCNEALEDLEVVEALEATPANISKN